MWSMVHRLRGRTCAPPGDQTRTLHYVVDGPLTTFFGGQRASDPVTAETELPFETLFEPYGDRVACLLADRLAQVGLDWQLVRAVAESH